ncbi:hypothetical protein B0186_01270 [Canicola haemoglobinophilus]|uniref:Uncharacterized conserved protein n=1 Tax=Canicola haemoglobinophilus TaxID=733 RepID=A0A1V4B3S1_9PAST|nr:DUF262 domain-containing protein [Canicola haemoglobinophilus]OOS02020.1 hypothetical protein B0186_01270 [Canicola haemoglobinophilus]STO60474.1 Uncharacterized conserved protein [Canicola haemoglobinophilus]
MSNQIEKLKINDLAISGSYIVPIYQRNYAWGDTEINLLLDDILYAFKKNKANKKNKAKYYIGSLVVFKRDNNFEVIDGQQRLTTLSILLSSLENKRNINLSFQHREASNNSLKKIEDVIQSPRIEEGFEIIGRKLAGIKKILGINYSEFEDFILENVIILRTEVPEHTDLNHYFEIMNSRGEQLEKHEVVKARLMDLLEKSDSNEQKAFSMIWNACSNMDFYALKGFPYSSKKEESLRTKLFGDDCNGTLFSMKFDDLKSHFESSTSSKNIASLKDILAGNNQSENLYNDENFSKEEKTDAKFNSIIDFPNFLMHVLRIYLKNKELPLNDKELITQFEKITTSDQAKEFIMVLLRTRLLFDRYIIKSKPDIEDGWSLKGLKNYSTYFKEVDTFGNAWEKPSSSEEDDNKADANDQYKKINQEKIIKLLSMFHVSFRQRIYKEWLYDVLEWLYAKNEDKYSINASSYISFLEKLANKYYCDGRGDENPLLNDKFLSSKESKLNQGTGVNNYVFNYLDYLIWRDGNLCDKASKFLPLDKFKFSMSRNSIEHYFSQNRVSELKDNSLLDNFGNLCLISNYQNSSLSDHSCESKKSRYENKELQCVSLKQAIMLSYKKWNDKRIKRHNKAMREILAKEISNVSKKKEAQSTKEQSENTIQ